MEAVFKACPDNTFVPEISFENTDSPFKKKIFFKENFSSIDMLAWLKYGLRTEKIVSSSSESDWFESGSSAVVFDGTEYSSGSSLSVNEYEKNTPNDVVIITRINNSGTMDRSFKFTFYQSVLEELENRSEDIDSYFSSLSSLAQMTKTEDEYGNTEFILEMKNTDPQTVLSETAKIFHDENAEFSYAVSEFVPVTEDEKKLSYDVRFDLTELTDGYYYTDNDIAHYYYFPGDVEVIEDDKKNVNIYSTFDNDGSEYFYLRDFYGEEGTVPTFSLGWDVDFFKAAAELSFSGDNPDFSAMVYLPSDIMEAAKNPVKAKLEKALPEGVVLSESVITQTVRPAADEEAAEASETASDVTKELIEYKLKMSGGNSEEVAKRYKNFIYNYTGQKTECSFSNEKGVSGSPFLTMSSYSAEFDMSPLSDGREVDITYSKAPGEKIFVTENCSFRADSKQADDGKLTGISQSKVRFIAVTESVNILGIILTVIAAAAGIALIAVVGANAKGWLAHAKKKAAAAPKYTPRVNISAAPSNSAEPPANSSREPVYSGAVSARKDTDNGNGDDEEEFI